jgi:hypothetical protein
MSLAEHFYSWNDKFIWVMHMDREYKVISEIEEMFLADYEKMNHSIYALFNKSVLLEDLI